MRGLGLVRLELLVRDAVEGGRKWWAPRLREE